MKPPVAVALFAPCRATKIYTCLIPKHLSTEVVRWCSFFLFDFILLLFAMQPQTTTSHECTHGAGRELGRRPVERIIWQNRSINKSELNMNELSWKVLLGVYTASNVPPTADPSPIPCSRFWFLVRGTIRYPVRILELFQNSKCELRCLWYHISKEALSSSRFLPFFPLHHHFGGKRSVQVKCSACLWSEKVRKIAAGMYCIWWKPNETCFFLFAYIIWDFRFGIGPCVCSDTDKSPWRLLIMSRFCIWDPDYIYSSVFIQCQCNSNNPHPMPFWSVQTDFTTATSVWEFTIHNLHVHVCWFG